MDAKNLMDQILSSGKNLWQDGRQAAERTLNVPASGEQRDARLDGLAQGALATGLLGLLVGTRRGRRLGGKIITYGGLAGLGALAWRTLQDWQKQQPVSNSVSNSAARAGDEPIQLTSADLATPLPIPVVSADQADQRSQRLLQTLVLACRADGHIDAQEHQRLVDHIRGLNCAPDVEELLMRQLTAPLDTQALARQVSSAAEAAEIYLAARMVIDIDQDQERQFLEQLARDLKLDSQFAARLDQAALA